MTKTILVTDIIKNQHKSGILEVSILGNEEVLLLTPHSCQVLFELFIKWGIIDKHNLQLAIRNIEYKRG